MVFWLPARLLEAMYALLHDHVLAVAAAGAAVLLATEPLRRSSRRNQQRLQELRPELKAAQEAHKDDRQSLNAALSTIYRENGVNPVNGCLPLAVMALAFWLTFRVLEGASFDPDARADPPYLDPASDLAGSLRDGGGSYMQGGVDLSSSIVHELGRGDLAAVHVILLAALIAAQVSSWRATRGEISLPHAKRVELAFPIVAVAFALVAPAIVIPWLVATTGLRSIFLHRSRSNAHPQFGPGSEPLTPLMPDRLLASLHERQLATPELTGWELVREFPVDHRRGPLIELVRPIVDSRILLGPEAERQALAAALLCLQDQRYPARWLADRRTAETVGLALVKAGVMEPPVDLELLERANVNHLAAAVALLADAARPPEGALLRLPDRTTRSRLTLVVLASSLVSVTIGGTLVDGLARLGGVAGSIGMGLVVAVMAIAPTAAAGRWADWIDGGKLRAGDPPASFALVGSAAIGGLIGIGANLTAGQGAGVGAGSIAALAALLPLSGLRTALPDWRSAFGIE